MKNKNKKTDIKTAKTPKKPKKPLKTANRAESRNYEITLNQEQISAVMAALSFTAIGDAVLDVVDTNFYDVCKKIVRHFHDNGVRLPKYLSFYSPFEAEGDEQFVKDIGGKIVKV